MLVLVLVLLSAAVVSAAAFFFLFFLMDLCITGIGDLIRADGTVNSIGLFVVSRLQSKRCVGWGGDGGN